MECEFCSEHKIKDDMYNDCVLEYLDQIKLHYFFIRAKVKEKDEIIQDLIAKNHKLISKVKLLETDKDIPDVTGAMGKRRKTNSYGSESESDAFSLKNVSSEEKLSSLEELNNALKDDLQLEGSRFDISKNLSKNIEKFVSKNENCPSTSFGILMPSNNRSEIKRSSENDKDSTDSDIPIIVPNDLEAWEKRNNSTADESRNLLPIGSKWRSKGQNKENEKNLFQFASNATFNKSGLSISPSPEKNTSTRGPRLAKASLSLRSAGRLRQSRLKFNSKKTHIVNSPTKAKEENLKSVENENVKPKLREQMENIFLEMKKDKHSEGVLTAQKQAIATEQIMAKENQQVSTKENKIEELDAPTEELITPSPTCIKVNETNKSRHRTFRKTESARKMPPPKSPPISRTLKQNEASNFSLGSDFTISSPPDNKNSIFNLQLNDDNQSLFMMPSPTMDVITIKDTELPVQKNIDEDFLKKIADESVETSRFTFPPPSKLDRDNKLKLDIKKNENKEKKNNLELSKGMRNYNKEDGSKKLIANDCPDCKAYMDFIGRDLTDKELEKRIKNCTKHKKPIRLNETPEGFWDPCFPSTQELNTRFGSGA